MTEAIFGLVGVIVGSFLTIAKDAFEAWWRRKEEGSYSAIRLICILYEYADHCVDVVQDDGTSYGEPAERSESGEGYYVAQVQAPAPPNYPHDIAWRSLPEGIMHQILSLPNKARATDRYVNAVADHALPPDYSELFEARQEGYAKLSYEALSLADLLATKFRITATNKVDLGSDWDTKSFIRDKISAFEKLKRERSAHFSSRLAEPPASPPKFESGKNEQ